MRPIWILTVTLFIFSCQTEISLSEQKEQKEKLLKQEMLQKGKNYLNAQFEALGTEQEKDIKLINFKMDTTVYLSQGGLDKLKNVFSKLSSEGYINYSQVIEDLTAQYENSIREEGSLREKYNRQLIGWSETGRELERVQEQTKELQTQLDETKRQQEIYQRESTLAETEFRDLFESMNFCIDRDTVGYVSFISYDAQYPNGSVQKSNMVGRPVLFDLDGDIRAEWNDMIWEVMK